jgi:hypothetical protein
LIFLNVEKDVNIISIGIVIFNMPQDKYLDLEKKSGQLFDNGQSAPYTKMAENVQGARIESQSAINRTYRRGHCGKGQMRSASEQPSEPPYGERERLVAANDAAVCLVPIAMALGGRWGYATN